MGGPCEAGSLMIITSRDMQWEEPCEAGGLMIITSRDMQWEDRVKREV